MVFVDSPVARKDCNVRQNDYQIFYVDPAIDESCSSTPCFLFFLHIENTVIKY